MKKHYHTTIDDINKSKTLPLWALTGCVPQFSIRVYNNTSQESKVIIIESDDGKEQSEHIILPHSSLEIDGLKYSKLITLDGIWSYDPKNIYKSGIDDRFWFVEELGLFSKKQEIKLQLESNGFLYILTKEQSFPATIFFQQPNGFPIKLSQGE